MEPDNQLTEAHFVDLLEQIKRTNDMIAFHRQHSEDPSMLLQYEYMKIGFILKLNRTLKDYQLHIAPTPIDGGQ